MPWSKLATAGLAALLVTLLLTPVIRRIALKLNLVCHTRADRHNCRVVPLLGGLAILSGFLAGILPFAGLHRSLPHLIAGILFVFGVGLLDDLRPLTPRRKLVGQIIAACIPAFSNLGALTSWDRAFSSLVMVFWAVSITNAFNLIDNIDGLAAGTAVTCAGFVFVLALQSSSAVPLLLSVCLGGASAGFLIYNFHPARIFMGDSGSLLLGYTLAYAARFDVRLRDEAHILQTLLERALLLGLPLFDTCFVILVRTFNGRRIWHGGRDHISHRLVALGLTDTSTVLLLYGISAILSSCALVLHGVSWPVGLLLGCFLLGLLFVGGYLLAQVKVDLGVASGQQPESY